MNSRGILCKGNVVLLNEYWKSKKKFYKDKSKYIERKNTLALIKWFIKQCKKLTIFILAVLLDRVKVFRCFPPLH